MTKFLTYIFIFLFTFTSSVDAGYFVKSESGLTVAGSLYSIQDSARKIYSWIEGEGYRGNTTYVDPIDGRTYTAEGNIKEGAIELATAAAISGVFKIGGKVVSNVRASKELSKITKTSGSEVVNDVKNINFKEALVSKLRGIEKAQTEASSTRILSDGRIRYYEKMRPANNIPKNKSVYNIENSYVTEYNPQTGSSRSWAETYNNLGKVSEVHPKSINGQVITAPHYKQ